jgi:tRNA threonylcarbamoyladenosine biosynthesis protein TsaE
MAHSQENPYACDGECIQGTMTEMKTKKLTMLDAKATEKFGEQIGAHLRGGEVMELVSDLGGGKTTFTRGLARGASSTDHVASPTFTISREYATDKFTIHHFDFYRLHEAGVVAEELHELVGDPQAVVVVEWSDIVQHVLPADHLKIEIQQTGEEEREFVVSYPESLEYLLGGPA